MHRVTSWLQRWQNYMNCTSNFFRNHPILYIRPPATADCFQTSKNAPGRFGSHEEEISETEVYFEVKDKSFFKKGTELLEKRLNQCVPLEEDYYE